MKESNLEFKVQYYDTDAYKVAWHGSYMRWMEAGRVDWLYLNGVDIKELDEKEGIILPVVEINIKYKSSAKLLDDVVVRTKVIEKNNIHIIFEQTVQNKNSGQIYTVANVKGVGIKNDKIIRNLDTILNQG